MCIWLKTWFLITKRAATFHHLMNPTGIPMRPALTVRRQKRLGNVLNAEQISLYQWNSASVAIRYFCDNCQVPLKCWFKILFYFRVRSYRNGKVTSLQDQLSLQGRKHLLLLLHLQRLLLRFPSATRLSPHAHLLVLRLLGRLQEWITSAPYARVHVTALSFTATLLMLSTVILAPRDCRRNRRNGAVPNVPSVDVPLKRPLSSSLVKIIECLCLCIIIISYMRLSYLWTRNEKRS